MHSVLQLFSLASIQVVNAEGTCQNGARIIGSDNRMQYEAVDSLLRAGRLYLNTDNPAQSDGTITHWEYCYYPPNEPGIYQLFFTIFRPRTFNSIQLYERQSPILNFSISVNGLGDEFLCSSFIPVEQISVQQGDIIGVCLPRTNSLNIVSNTRTSSAILSGDRLFFGESDCSNIPEFVLGRTFLRLAVALQENRIAHFYGQISSMNNFVYITCTILCDHLPYRKYWGLHFYHQFRTEAFYDYITSSIRSDSHVYHCYYANTIKTVINRSHCNGCFK